MGNNITHKELIEQFICFEKSNDLLNWKIKDIPVWEFIRFSVFTQIKEHHSSNNINIKKVNFKNSFKVIYEFIINLFFINPFFIYKQKKVLILNHPRRKINKDYFIDIYTDPWLSVLNGDYYVFENLLNLNFAHYKPIKTKNVFYLDIIQLPSLLIRLLPYNIKLSDNELLIINEIENKINEKWNIKNLELKKEVSLIIKRYIFLKPSINSLLNKTNPSKIINVVSYSFINQMFTCLAKKKNIQVFELQHGTVGRYHIAYNMGVKDLDQIETFPDYFLAWGEGWIKDVRMPIIQQNIKIVGFPYFETYQSVTNKERDLKQILILSQYKKNIADYAMQIAENLPDYKIVYKAHPLEYFTIDDLLNQFGNFPNIQIINNDKIHLYELFSSSNYVIGVNSTALIEAISFCPNIFILKMPGWEYYEDLEESPSLRFINNLNELIKAIVSQESSQNKINISKYFTENSIIKLSECINE